MFLYFIMEKRALDDIYQEVNWNFDVDSKRVG